MRILSGLIVMSLFAAGVVAQTDDVLPTPYTAEQIRDTWREGMTLVTRVTTPKGITTSKTEVVGWTEEGVTLTDQALDANGAPKGEPAQITATWEELRDHASFSAAEAQRERATIQTPLGELSGWRYVHARPDGARAMFFFADDYPGAPVVYSERRTGLLVMRSEQIERMPAP